MRRIRFLTPTVNKTKTCQKPDSPARRLDFRWPEESCYEVRLTHLTVRPHSTGGLARLKSVLLILFSALFMQLSALAVQSVNLTWDPSTSTNIMGYNIYYGTASGAYTKSVSVGNVTNAVISGLVDGTTYYFAATAYDNTGSESDFSNETTRAIPSVATLSMKTVGTQGAATSIVITASGAVFDRWELESSPDLKNWTTIAGGTNSSVNISVPITTMPAQFFRLKSQ